MPKDNIRKYLEGAMEKFGEPIEAIVVGVHYNRRYGDESNPKADENVILTAEQGLAKLDDDYDAGFGGAGCYPMYAWTKSRVFFIGEYDGATGLNWVPRNPTAMEPSFSGEDA